MEREDHDRKRVRDIVERLTAEDILTSIITSVWCKVGRHPGELADLTKEAAEEITRLRAENEKLEQQVAEFVNRFTEDMFVLRAENETLRRDVRTAVMGDSAELRDVKRENEKLRKALKPFAHNYQNNGLSHSTFMFAMKDLLAAKKALGDTDE